jgi:hypothetical protein
MMTGPYRACGRSLRLAVLPDQASTASKAQYWLNLRPGAIGLWGETQLPKGPCGVVDLTDPETLRFLREHGTRPCSVGFRVLFRQEVL